MQDLHIIIIVSSTVDDEYIDYDAGSSKILLNYSFWKRKKMSMLFW